MKRIVAALGAVVFLAAGARAGLSGQPLPSADTVVRLRAAVRQFVIPGGDLGKARPDLILLVERDPTADLTDFLAPALLDTVAYQGVADAFAEALENETDETKKNYLRYNLARLHLIRARFYNTSTQKRPILEVAARLAGQIPNALRDNAAAELKGDIELERGDTTAAMTAYGRITGPGGTALSQYKMGQAYQKTSRYREAETAYAAALKADAQSASGQGQLHHYVWQALGSTYLAQRRDADALNALSRSVKVKTSEGGNVRFLSDLARALLARGYKKEVAAYAQSALKLAPDDPEMSGLAAEAGG
jgi:tetratricopeptide (TPR) repeat protein